MRTHCVTCKITIDNAFMDAATLAVDIDTEEQSAQSASDHLVALSISQGKIGESSAPTEAQRASMLSVSRDLAVAPELRDGDVEKVVDEEDMEDDVS